MQLPVLAVPAPFLTCSARLQVGLGEVKDDRKAQQELTETKHLLADKVQALKLSDSMAKDITFLVVAQLTRKRKRMQHHAVWPQVT